MMEAIILAGGFGSRLKNVVRDPMADTGIFLGFFME